MKRLVIAALAIAAIAACTKSNVQYEQPGEISLQPVAQKATKAAVDETVYPTDAAYNFNVWAWWGDYDAATALASFTTTTPYIANGTFVHRTETVNSWGGQTPYYWPTKGSLVFAGYSPASAKVEGTEFNYYLTAQGTEGQADYVAPNTLLITNYIQPNTIADAKDLMWFDVTDKSYDQNGAENKGVPVQFKHALSWLTFKFNLKDDKTAARWTITDVKLVGIEDKATFTAVKNGANTWTEAVKSGDSKDEISVVTGVNYIVTYANGGTVLPGTDVVVEGTNARNNAVLVIPQSCAPGTPAVDETPAVPADAELVITYNLKTYVNDGVLEGQTVTLPLNGTQITDNKWVPGKHYIYTIKFGANEILIAPTVADWEDVTVDPINVQ